MGTLAEGLTVKDEPIHSKRSHLEASCRALVRSWTGNFQPKQMMESISQPLQFQQLRPVLWSWGQPGLWPLFIVRNARKYLRPHYIHFSKFRLPCSSDIRSKGTPDFKCNPSVFCETRYLNIPLSIKVFIAICVTDGTARSTISSIRALGADSEGWRFQIPGPVPTTVSGPDRKSGIPRDVEHPAPVKKIGWVDF